MATMNGTSIQTTDQIPNGNGVDMPMTNGHGIDNTKDNTVKTQERSETAEAEDYQSLSKDAVAAQVQAPDTNKSYSFTSYQHEIYLGGVKKLRPIMTTDPHLWESAAAEVMKPEAFAYAKGGAGACSTIRKNLEAFQKWSLLPRMVQANVTRDMGVTVLGERWNSPIAVAPVGVNKVFHEDGETGVARAAGQMGIPYVLSTFTSCTLEEVATAQDEGFNSSQLHGGAAQGRKPIRWLQLYWPQSVDQSVTRSLLARAKSSGYSALVITLDIFSMGWRPLDIDNAYLPLYLGLSTALGFSDPAFRKSYIAKYGMKPEDDIFKGALAWEETIFPGVAHDWPELQFLRDEWDGPILVKGIQCAADAEQAVRAGVDGIIVSNHGGRQYDGAIGSLTVLREIVEAVGDKTEVMFDSGIRCGADVMKAMALGAKSVFVGRPIVYGLGARGAAGALHVMRTLLADLDINLAICGAHGVEDLSMRNLRWDP